MIFLGSFIGGRAVLMVHIVAQLLCDALHMNNAEQSYGRELYNLVEKAWKSQGLVCNSWCDAHPGLSGPTVSRWRSKGHAPQLDKIRLVADALGMGMLELLVAIGVVTDAEASGPTKTIKVWSFDEALCNDPTLTDPREKAIHQAVRKAFT
jgi:hypothetical protein